MVGVVLKQINAAVNDPSGFAFKLGFTRLHVHNWAVFPPLPCTDDMRMHAQPYEVIETGYFGEEEVARSKCHGC